MTLYFVVPPDDIEPYQIAEIKDTSLRDVPLHARRWTDRPDLKWAYSTSGCSYGPLSEHFAERKNAAHEIVRRIASQRDDLNKQIDYWRQQR